MQLYVIVLESEPGKLKNWSRLRSLSCSVRYFFCVLVVLRGGTCAAAGGPSGQVAFRLPKGLCTLADYSRVQNNARIEINGQDRKIFQV